MVAVTVAVADLEGCVLIRLVCSVMHWIGRDENANVRDMYMYYEIITRTVFTVNPATLDLPDDHG